MADRFMCDIGDCGEMFHYSHPYGYFAHIRDEHEQTYRENKEYIDAKLVVLLAESDIDGRWAI